MYRRGRLTGEREILSQGLGFIGKKGEGNDIEKIRKHFSIPVRFMDTVSKTGKEN